MVKKGWGGLAKALTFGLNEDGKKKEKEPEVKNKDDVVIKIYMKQRERMI